MFCRKMVFFRRGNLTCNYTEKANALCSDPCNDDIMELIAALLYDNPCRLISYLVACKDHIQSFSEHRKHRACVATVTYSIQKHTKLIE